MGRITTTEVERAVLQAQIKAYEERYTTNSIPVPSAKVDQMIASTALVQKLQKFIDDKRWRLIEIEMESTRVCHDASPADQNHSPMKESTTTVRPSTFNVSSPPSSSSPVGRGS